MFTDLRTSGSAVEDEVDLCIIGGGAAGISLALALAGGPISVCIVEAGGFQLERETQDLYKGGSVGLEYGALDETRFRYFGGSTNPEGWGGWCRPLEPTDFEHRDWVPYSGWPIDRRALEPYYRRAQVVCELGPYDYDIASWESHLGRPIGQLPLTGQRIETHLTQLSRPTRFGTRYRDDLGRADGLTVYLNANVTEIVATPDRTEATAVEAVTLDGRSRLLVRCRAVVVAAGGIENARILLLSGGEGSTGLGNENDLVGRFFMDHPRLSMGAIEFTDARGLPDLYDPYYKFRKRNRALSGVYDETLVAASLNLTPEFQRDQGLLNYRAWILPTWPGDDTESIEALKRIYFLARERTPRSGLGRDVRSVLFHPLLVGGWVSGRLARPRRLVRSLSLVNIVEPEQMPESRITLGHEVDRLGLPRVQLDWRVGKLVPLTIARAHEAIDEELRRAGIGRVVDPFVLDDEQRFLANLRWAWHHMGTTRMHEDPAQGVVNADLRLHGMSNVYAAGSSVFPTPGSDLPTLTIVALSLRLADHISQTLTGVPLGSPDAVTARVGEG